MKPTPDVNLSFNSATRKVAGARVCQNVIGERLKVSRHGEVVLFWDFMSCDFILKSNSPLVSGHLPFLMCHRSDCLP